MVRPAVRAADMYAGGTRTRAIIGAALLLLMAFWLYPTTGWGDTARPDAIVAQAPTPSSATEAAPPLQTAPAAAQPAAPLLLADTLHRLTDRARAKIAWYVDTLSSWSRRIDPALNKLEEQAGRFGILTLLLFVGAFAAAGFGMEWVFWAASRRLRLRIVDAVYDTPGERVARFAIRIGINLLSLSAFAIGTYSAVLVMPWPPDLARVVLSVLGIVFASRIAAGLIGRLLMSPYRADLRVLPLTDPQAKVAYHWTIALVTAGAIMMSMSAMLRRIGVDGDAVRVLMDVCGLGLVVLVLVFLWHWRHRFEEPPQTRRLTNTLTFGLLVIAVPLVWLFAILDYPALAITVAAAGLIPWMVRLAHAMLLMVTDPDAYRETGAPANLTIALIDRLLRAIIVLGGALTVSSAWGYDLGALLDRVDTGSTVLRALFDIAAAWLLADLIWYVARTAIDSRLSNRAAAADSDEAVRQARLATLLPLLRTSLALMLLLIAVMISLSALGVNIGPLLAGAGVAGIAIGFGAQTLVRDIFSGVFFLLDDAFRVGEYVEIERQKGVVEAISLRSMRLRHHRGPMHTIPYGQIRSLTNHSRDWVIQKLEFRLPFETDVGLVKKLVKKIGADLMNEPEYAKAILEPPKSQGARRLEEFGMVLIVKFKARPGEQFGVVRELHHRLLAAFRENGIRLQMREMLIREPPQAGAPANAQHPEGAQDGDGPRP